MQNIVSETINGVTNDDCDDDDSDENDNGDGYGIVVIKCSFLI